MIISFRWQVYYVDQLLHVCAFDMLTSCFAALRMCPIIPCVHGPSAHGRKHFSRKAANFSMSCSHSHHKMYKSLLCNVQLEADWPVILAKSGGPGSKAKLRGVGQCHPNAQAGRFSSQSWDQIKSLKEKLPQVFM